MVRAGLDHRRPITLDITTDGPTTVTLLGPGGWTRVESWDRGAARQPR